MSSIKYMALREELNVDVKPAYFVKGGDGYLIDRTRKIFCSLVMPDYADFNLSIISIADGSTTGDAVDALQTLPVFDERRVVIVKDTSDKPSEASLKSLFDYLANPNPSSVFVFFSENDGYKPLEKQMQIVDCNALEGVELLREMDVILAAEPAKAMNDAAKQTLASYTKGDLAKISNEIVKLKAYSENEITIDDVKMLVAPDLEAQIYELASAVSEKNNSKALQVLDLFLKDTSIKPITVMSLLIGQYRKMLHISLSKETDLSVIAQTLGISRGALYYAKSAAKNYTQLKLKKIVEMLGDLQFKMLSESMDGVCAMQNAVAMLMVI